MVNEMPKNGTRMAMLSAMLSAGMKLEMGRIAYNLANWLIY